MKYPKLRHDTLPSVLRDMAVAAEYGSLPHDQRVQLKLPSQVVEAVDYYFSEDTRSKIVTQLLIDLLTRRLRYHDRPDLGELVDSEQDMLDVQWDYLEARDAGR